MDVHAEDVEPAVERVGDERPRSVGRQPELRAVVPRADRLVRVRVDAERHPDEGALHAGLGRERRLVGRVEHDRGADPRRLRQEALALVVAVDDELRSPEPRGRRERELALGRDVGADPLLGQEAQHGHVRQGLRPEEDPAVADRVAERPRTAADRLLAEHDERRPVLGGELRRRHAAERELPVVDGRRVGEEVEDRGAA